MPKNIENAVFSSDGNTLWRTVVPVYNDRGQKSYTHSCVRFTFESICHDIEALNGKPFTSTDIYKGKYPHSQAATALAFLEERGLIAEYKGRQLIATSTSVHLDAMTEFDALHEEKQTA